MSFRLRRVLVTLGLAGALSAALYAKNAKADFAQVTQLLQPLSARDSANETLGRLGLLLAAVDQFKAQHPADGRRWDAELLRLTVLPVDNQLGRFTTDEDQLQRD